MSTSQGTQAPQNIVEETDLDFEWEVREDSTPYLKHMGAGCIAGMVEHSAMFPFDNIKTHSQVTSNMKFTDIVKQLFREGGIPAFYRGIGLVACGSMPAHAAFFSVYEFARSYFDVNDEEHHPYLFALTGATATFVHDLIMTPIDVVKQRKQISNLPIMQLVKNMIRQEGKTSLLRSFPITYMMNVPLSAILVSTNETVKLHMKQSIQHNFFSYFAIAGFSGAVAATLTTPLDVIKTKLQTQEIYQKHCGSCETTEGKGRGAFLNKGNRLEKGKSKSVFNFGSKNNLNPCEKGETIECRQAKYQNILQTFKLIVKEEGFRGFFRGFGSRIIIISPSSAISWATYESIKKYLLAPTQSH